MNPIWGFLKIEGTLKGGYRDYVVIKRVQGFPKLGVPLWRSP